ncbi:hypothetical protein [Sphingomonas sp. 35-24ZXX]|nr:hypothetical protein [Sphingomonas sp. 35-24ZXX]
MFENLHIAHLRALHAPGADERDEQRQHARLQAALLHAHVYPQPGSFLPG